MSDKKKTVVLLRGGIDSAICLADAVEERGKENVVALYLYYGQVHKKEKAAAKRLAEYYRVEYMEMDISKVMSFSQSKALADHVSKDESDYSDKKAEVPFRNGLMISVAASVALSIGADSVRMAVHADESAGRVYPDKRESFLRTMAAAVNEGTDGELKLILPFADMSKKQVMMHGVKLGVPFAHTWSCYESDNEPCGYCVGCKGRAAAFKLIDEEDPLLKK